MKQTQIQSYILIKESLGKRHKQILELLSVTPLTIHEISQSLNLPLNSISGRLTELEKKGKIQPKGIIYYEPTKRNITIWGYNNG